MKNEYSDWQKLIEQQTDDSIISRIIKARANLMRQGHNPKILEISNNGYKKLMKEITTYTYMTQYTAELSMILGMTIIRNNTIKGEYAIIK